MPSNKFQYSQRLDIINKTIEKLKKEKIKPAHITELCKLISKDVSLVELDLFVKKPENFKSKPKPISYQTLLTNKEYKNIVNNFYEELTSKKIHSSKQLDFEKDLEISNLKEKIRRLEMYISSNETVDKVICDNHNESKELNDAYKLINSIVNTYNDLIFIDMEDEDIINLADFPKSSIADKSICKGFIKFVKKNNLKHY